MDFASISVGILCVWRITYLAYSEHGPWRVLSRLRDRVRPTFLGSLLACFYCLSLWVSAPFAAWIGQNGKERFLFWVAFSGGAILLERVTAREENPPPALYFEHEGEDDVLLRRKYQNRRSGSERGYRD
jgi:hypothetical protein